ncbi:MAG TPA: hypothetical protein VKB12_14575 [Pyrinomonadaceae bacterium]|nr:hypothetical protein [Pyrinomonadaceae bacterium]
MSLTKLRNPNYLMPAAVLLAGAATILLGERQTVNDGLGWDSAYAYWVKDFYNLVLVHGLPEYFTRRILPSLLVRVGMTLFSVPLENENIVRAFQLYNLALLTLSACVWGLVADETGIGSRGKWFGFLFLFVNFAEWKCTFFVSVWTDTTAFTLGLLIFYFYLKDNAYGMALVIFLSGFTWPTAPFMGALLFIFPRPKTPTGPTAGMPRGLSSLLAGLFSLATLAALLYLTNSGLDERLGRYYLLVSIDKGWLYLSIAATAVYLFLALRVALDDRRLFDRLTLRSLSRRRVLVAVSILALTKIIQRSVWDGTDIAVGSLRAFGIHTLLTSLTEPLIFLVAHAVYYGPAVLLMALYWRRLCRTFTAYGAGMGMFLILNAAFSVAAQSRWLINAFPVFVAVLVKALEPALKRQSLFLWAALCLLYSKVWYQINAEPLVFDGTMDCLLRFPMQRMFMNIGPYMSRPVYLLQGAAVALTAVTLYYFYKVRGRTRKKVDGKGQEM